MFPARGHCRLADHDTVLDFQCHVFISLLQVLLRSYFDLLRHFEQPTLKQSLSCVVPSSILSVI